MNQEKQGPDNCGAILPDKKAIYIVDDDESVCRALSALIKACGYEVKAFSCAADFFSNVPESAPGCLLLDIHMTVLDGWKTLARLRKTGSKRPVIIMSAEKNNGLKDQSVKAGAKGFLQKPFDEKELFDLINA